MYYIYLKYMAKCFSKMVPKYSVGRKKMRRSNREGLTS
jgi:hypothetical protein